MKPNFHSEILDAEAAIGNTNGFTEDVRTSG